MNRTIVSVLIVAAAGLFVQCQGAPTRTEDPGRAEQEVRHLNTEEVDAFLKKDPRVLAQLWSDDFVVTNPLNRFVTRQQVLGMVESGVLVITSFDRQIEYVKVYGSTVIVAGSETCVFAGKLPFAGTTQHLRFTGVWMNQGGRWQQVARHANIVPGQP
jgi:hypothetical protein